MPDPAPCPLRAVLFDWGDTLMHDDPAADGPMADWPRVSALPGALQALQWARQFGLVCIASGAHDSDSTDIRRALARVGLADAVDQIFCSRELGYPKSDPRFWAAVSQALALPPASLLMIGDQYATDVAAPRAAGLHTLWFNGRHAPPQPGPSIQHWQELPQYPIGNLLES